MKEQTKKILKKLGLTDLQIEKLINHHSLITTKDETLAYHIIDNYNYFLELKFLPSEIIKMLVKSPEIFILAKQNLTDKILNLQDNGYTNDEVYKLIKNNPKIINYSIKYLNQKIEELIKLGYEKEQVLKMCLKAATLLELDIDNNIKKKINEIENLGFTYEEVIKISIRYPEIFSHNITTISKQLENLESLGFTKEEVKHIIINFPAVIGLSYSNIKEKIDYINEIDAHEAILINPSNLITSVSTLYSRKEYFNNNNITFESKSKYISYLFCGNIIFEKRFGISKNTLLTKYNYKEYCEELNNGKAI